MHFSKAEIKEILKAWIITSLAFAIAFVVRDQGVNAIIGNALIGPFILSFFTVGTGIVLHELGHKYFGQKFGKHSEFKAFDKLLFGGVMLSLFGMIFVLPGAVWTSGRISRRELGIIALAGPAINFILGFVFIPLFLFTSGLLQEIGAMGVEINFLLAVFNFLPLGMFDGAKVLAWNKWVWGIGIILSGLMAFVSMQLIRGGF